MNSFQIFQPTRLLFGDNHLSTFIEHSLSFGNHIFIVTGGGSIKKLGYLDMVVSAFEEKDAQVSIFEGIEPNPVSTTINAAAEQARKANADLILGFGGGSVMDASKAIGALVKMNETDIWPFVGGEERSGQLVDSLPILTIPTTAATASEVTAYAVISNPKVNGKSGLGHESLKPKLSWLNPAFTTKVPLVTTRDGAADILSHVFENYLLGGEDASLTDRYCEAVMITVLETLPKLTHDLENLALRADLLWASNLALNGYHSAGRNPAMFILHAIEHAMSGYQPKLAHGRGLATLYPAYFKWLLTNGRGVKRLAQLGHRLFNVEEESPERAAQAFIDMFEVWLVENDLYQSANSLGIPDSAFESIAAYVLKTTGNHTEVRGVLGTMSKDDIISILRSTNEQYSE